LLILIGRFWRTDIQQQFVNHTHQRCDFLYRVEASRGPGRRGTVRPFKAALALFGAWAIFRPAYFVCNQPGINHAKTLLPISHASVASLFLAAALNANVNAQGRADGRCRAESFEINCAVCHSPGAGAGELVVMKQGFWSALGRSGGSLPHLITPKLSATWGLRDAVIPVLENPME
jgi:hypothetical protein